MQITRLDASTLACNLNTRVYTRPRTNPTGDSHGESQEEGQEESCEEEVRPLHLRRAWKDLPCSPASKSDDTGARESGHSRFRGTVIGAGGDECRKCRKTKGGTRSPRIRGARDRNRGGH